MTILAQMNHFAERFGKQVIVNNTVWPYYRLGQGAPIFWLTGRLRRVAFGFAFLERLAARHTVIAPDYPPVRTTEEFIRAFDVILQAEGVDTFVPGCQSYGGMLAQAYLAHKPGCVERLILSSTGPADYSKAWLPVAYLVIALVRLLPEQTAKRLLTGMLLKAITVPATERGEWLEAIYAVIQNDLSRADVISHFAVAADLIRKGIVTPAAYRDWKGRVFALSPKTTRPKAKRTFPGRKGFLGGLCK